MDQLHYHDANDQVIADVEVIKTVSDTKGNSESPRNAKDLNINQWHYLKEYIGYN